MSEAVSNLFLLSGSTIADAIACIDRSGRISIALLVDSDCRLVNTISDGDVRRGILAGLRLSDPVEKLLPIKALTPHPVAVTAAVGTDREQLLAIMRANSIRQIPLVDDNGVVIEVVLLTDLLPQLTAPFEAVVMAGGFGTRLRPLTENVPKPMLPVGGRPVMELIIDQLRNVGVHDIHVSTHYMPEKIVAHFGDGEAFGVRINYVNEEQPLGTGGVLGLMQAPQQTVLVINGDILTDVDFGSMFAYHQEQEAHMTVAVRRYDVQVPYGVVDCDGPVVRALREKPKIEFYVNAGIYFLEPCVFQFVAKEQHLNMTELIDRLLENSYSVVSFPIREYWLDIGQHADYERAQEDARAGKIARACRAADTAE